MHNQISENRPLFICLGTQGRYRQSWVSEHKGGRQEGQGGKCSPCLCRECCVCSSLPLLLVLCQLRRIHNGKYHAAHCCQPALTSAPYGYHHHVLPQIEATFLCIYILPNWSSVFLCLRMHSRINPFTQNDKCLQSDIKMWSVDLALWLVSTNRHFPWKKTNVHRACLWRWGFPIWNLRSFNANATMSQEHTVLCILAATQSIGRSYDAYWRQIENICHQFYQSQTLIKCDSIYFAKLCISTV